MKDSKNVFTIVIFSLLGIFIFAIICLKVFTTPYDKVHYSNVVTSTRYIWTKLPTESEVTTTAAGLKTGDIVEQNGHYYLVNPDGTGTEVPPPGVLK